MSGRSDFLELEVLDHILGNAAYTAPATTYIALYTAVPTDAGGGTEVSGGSYARVAFTNNATNWPAAAAGAKANGVTRISAFVKYSGAVPETDVAAAVVRIAEGTIDAFVGAIA